MKRFDIVKTLQLALLVLLSVISVLLVLSDGDLYAAMAADSHIRRLGILLWATLGLSFLFLFYDFNSYSDLKRENIELDNAVYSDALTGIANRHSVDMYLARFVGKNVPEDMGCVTLELTNLSSLNSELGHNGGDEAIQAFTDALLRSVSGACFLGRNGGNKFVAIFRDCSDARIERFLAAVRSEVDERNAERPDAPVRYASGVAFREGEAVKTVTELVALSDRRLRQVRN
ncbi:MAG: GGDEF domain-containing protein [Oscillospiraceae bacterium]|nr:GGDEF domain-containing protein [Oscillospiraceae bacterium]